MGHSFFFDKGERKQRFAWILCRNGLDMNALHSVASIMGRTLWIHVNHHIAVGIEFQKLCLQIFGNTVRIPKTQVCVDLNIKGLLAKTSMLRLLIGTCCNMASQEQAMFASPTAGSVSCG